ncbi:hypothetical protein TorRG33x02_077920 [Trema orientale]|uniref:F-box protein At3g26010-like beta-propeller domain-containing protein n=1 Tax=Trema orientale TaxID=63057 RepID=A0A2P5FFG0_TREOI|nr:hypothetical protein TorRG33x02_077920 [Trema orientale]
MADEDESSIRCRIKKLKRKIDQKERSIDKYIIRLDQLRRQRKRLKSLRKKESKTNTADHEHATSPSDRFFMISALSEDLLLEIFLRLPNRQSVIRFGPVKEYYICNPFTKQWLALGGPPTHHHWWPHSDSSSGFGLVFEPNRKLGSTPSEITRYNRFRVLLIHKCGFHQGRSNRIAISASIFCSETGEWLKSYNSLRHTLQGEYYEKNFDFHRVHASIFHDVVTSNGLLFWLVGFRKCKGIIACDPFCCTENRNMKPNFEMKGRFIDLPAGFSHKWRHPSKGKVQLGVVRGQLRLLKLIKVNQACFGLKIWELVDYGDEIAVRTTSSSSWLLVHDVKLKDAQNVFVLAFHPNNGDAIFVVRDRKVYLYVIGEEKYEEIGEFPCDNYDDNVKERATGYLNVSTNMQPSWPSPVHDALIPFI